MASDDISDADLIHNAKRLYLKHISKMVIIVQLPELRVPGYSVSNWEVMEKLKTFICPNLFSSIKVTKSSLDFLHFEAEAGSKELLQKFIAALDGKCIKIGGISELLKIKAGKAKANFPKKHDWIAFFRDSSNFLDESKYGERPDTLHVKGLPLKWFTSENDKTQDNPSETVVKEFFETFGNLRNLDIPILDKYRPRMELQTLEENEGFRTFSFDSKLYFEVYVQYKHYTGFEKAMQGFKGRKLVHVLEDGKLASANLDVDFDRTFHLSEKNITRRDKMRKKLINFDLQQAELAERKKLEEQKRKEMERLEIIRQAEEKRRILEEKERQKEQKKVRKIEKRKVSRVRDKILKQEKCKQLKVLSKMRRKKEIERRKDARQFIISILQIVSKKKKKEEQENKKRREELKLLQELEKKRFQREEDDRKRKELEDRQRSELESREKTLRLKILQNVKEMEETKKEMRRELLRRELGSSKECLGSVVFTSSNDE